MRKSIKIPEAINVNLIGKFFAATAREHHPKKKGCPIGQPSILTQIVM